MQRLGHGNVLLYQLSGAGKVLPELPRVIGLKRDNAGRVCTFSHHDSR